jgi:hypothetical protein
MRSQETELAGSFLLSFTTLAIAQPAPSPDDPAPVFRSLGPDGTRGAGVDLAIIIPPDDAEGAEPLYRLDLSGEYVDARSGFGGFASLAIGHFSEDDGVEDESTTGIGDLEVGGLYRRENDQTTITGRVALALPTASDDDWGATLFGALFADPSNIILGYPETTSLRAAVTPGWTDGRFFVRADAGLDLTIDTPDGGEDIQVAHVDGAFGAVSGNVAGTLEMQNAWLMGDGDTLRVSHLAGTVQYAARTVNVYGGVGKAFIEDDGFLDDEDIWDLSLGVRGRF